ncbi:MAG: chemotaxis protein CheW [Rhodobacteraceae bacterium]|jgi:purine-binding chemotaxis protein CheW|nr:chemotaxis protein CheW [Paracoccaceae bacterium]
MSLHDLDDLDDLDDGALARDDQTARAASRTLLTFRLDGQVFAVDVTHVREILGPSEITTLPGAPPGVLGMIDLRGDAIAILDLSAHLALADTRGPESRIIVFCLDEDRGPGVSVAVVAQQVLRVCEVPANGVAPLPETTTPWRNADIEGLVLTEDGKAILLDILRILRGGRDLPGDFDFA